MAYKVFTNGSVLNASEVNENLMNQAVITFTNSTARASAITSPVEGMVTYLADTNTYQFWNGSAWTNLVSLTAGTGNILINGAFEINQRNYTSGSTIGVGNYSFDRWKSTHSGTTLTFTSAPQGQQVTINSGGSIEQVVERENLPAGTYTLSWTGTAIGRVYNTGATPPSYAASPITLTLDGLANVEVELHAQSGTATLSNVQLEAGSTATPFRRSASTIAGELVACQRYFQRLNGSWSSYGVSGSTVANYYRHLVVMRATPTVTVTTAPGYTNSSNLINDENSITGSRFYATVTSTGVGFAQSWIYTLASEL